MIPDSQTNFLYLADTLPNKYPHFYKQFEAVLFQNKIPSTLLQGTKDVWAVDYMPVQIERDRFVQFVYNPDYIRNYHQWQKTVSDVNAICEKINITPIKTDILLDGGNVIKARDKVIITNKVFEENATISEKNLIKKLMDLLEVDKLIFIPAQPRDFTGHADGMVRFLDENTVLINDYSKENKTFQLNFRLSLQNAGIDYIEIPYNPYNNKKEAHANGIYINYLQMQQVVIIPTFGIKEDDAVVKQFEQLFAGTSVVTTDANDIAYNGGILNCISWNVLK